MSDGTRASWCRAYLSPVKISLLAVNAVCFGGGVFLRIQGHRDTRTQVCRNISGRAAGAADGRDGAFVCRRTDRDDYGSATNEKYITPEDWRLRTKD